VVAPGALPTTLGVMMNVFRQCARLARDRALVAKRLEAAVLPRRSPARDLGWCT